MSQNHSQGKPPAKLSGPDTEITGGEGGIRTPDRLAPMPHFECGAFDHSATSPGVPTWNGRPPAVGASSRRGRRGRQGAGRVKFASRRQTRAGQWWDRQTRKKPAVPCRVIEIAAGKRGFSGQPERRNDGSDRLGIGNAICVLT